jgi:hypothetical protein
MLPFSKLMVRAGLGSLLCLSLACCSDMPVLRSQADRHITASPNSSDPVAAQCQQLRAQIRANQESAREAPTISTSPQIVAAAEGKADQRIQELRDRMESLDCADEGHSSHSSVPPLPAAPNAPNP